MQARAEATRRRILDSAVELFSELGYGETGLADVLERAGVSKGAFYYHFTSKEAVATAIIDEFDARVRAATDDLFDRSSPQLAGLIRATFEVQRLMREDRYVEVGQLLAQALGQVSEAGARMYSAWTTWFIEASELLSRAGIFRAGSDPRDIGEVIWSGVLGSHLVSAALGDDPYARLTRSWRLLLDSAVPRHLVDEVDDALRGVAADYNAVAVS